MPPRQWSLKLIPVLFVCGAAFGCGGGNPAGRVNAQAPTGTGFQRREVKLADGSTHKFSVFVPFAYTAKQAWPTIVFLQGLGEGGRDGVKNTTVGLGPAIARRPERFDFIAVFPQSGGRWSDGEAERLAIGCLDAVERQYRVDRSRVYLTGLSTGGYGVWSIGAKYARRFAALIPLCGYSGEAFASQLTDMPIWAFHNAGDPFVFASATKGTVRKINSLGGKAKQTIYGSLGHNCWDRAYDDPELYAWMKQQRR